MITKEELLERMTTPIYKPENVWNGVCAYMMMVGVAALVTFFLLAIWVGWDNAPKIVQKILDTGALVGGLGGLGRFFTWIRDGF